MHMSTSLLTPKHKSSLLSTYYSWSVLRMVVKSTEQSLTSTRIRNTRRSLSSWKLTSISVCVCHNLLLVGHSTKKWRSRGKISVQQELLSSGNHKLQRYSVLDTGVIKWQFASPPHSNNIANTHRKCDMHICGRPTS